MNIGKQSSNFMQLPFMKRRDTGASENKEKHLPLVGALPNRVRNHFVAMVGEFCGTFLFLFFAFAGTQVANAAVAAQAVNPQNVQGPSLPQAPNAPALLYISLAFGFSLAVNVWIFFRISGGLFNPAVTLGLALIGAISWARAGLVFIAEMLGGMAAAGVIAAILPGPMAVQTTLGGKSTLAQGLFIEMFLTTELVFTIFMLAAEKHKGTYLAPIGIGLALFIAELAGVFYTGGSLNPARSFGPCVALASFPSEHWIYWLGPALGSIIAVGFYRFVKMLEYETANPGADFNEKETEVFKFDEDNAATAADVARPNVAIGQPEYTADGMGVRPSSSESQNQIPGIGSRINSANSGEQAYRNAPQIEQGVPHVTQGDLHPGFAQPRQ